MSHTNTLTSVYTHEGAKAKKVNPSLALRRTVLSCFLWENEFYEAGQTVADRIKALIPLVPTDFVAGLAIYARTAGNLRHVPLLIVREMARDPKHKRAVADTLVKVIQRADELAEFLALYWKDGRQTLSNQVKRGLAEAFTKFNAYDLAKYNRDNDIKLRDVLFLCHAKPKNAEQAATWKQLIDGTLPTPDTWEVELSAKGNNRETWTRLLSENKLGYMALLRNLRNMATVRVDTGLIKDAIKAGRGADRVMPFRFVAAARACPQMEDALDVALTRNIKNREPLTGTTVVLVDVSRSMERPLSSKSDLTRLDAAATLASMINGERRVFSFSREIVEVPPRLGMAGVDAIRRSQEHNATYLGKAIKFVNENVEHDRIIVITDEQSDDPVGDPTVKNAYMINVESAKNGVGYGAWTHIDGFSESVLNYVQHVEESVE